MVAGAVNCRQELTAGEQGTALCQTANKTNSIVTLLIQMRRKFGRYSSAGVAGPEAGSIRLRRRGEQVLTCIPR